MPNKESKDYAGTCAICKEDCFYSESLQLNNAGQMVHDKCADEGSNDDE